MTCSPARKRASAPTASHGASCIFQNPRSISTRPPTPTTRRSTPRRPRNLKRMVADGVLIRDGKPCYYVYRLTWRGRTPDRPRRRRLARRLCDQPHPQARADDAAEGRRPRPPDRGDQRADRSGDERLSERAGNRRHAGAGGRRHSRKSTSPPTTACVTSSGAIADDATIDKLTRAFERAAGDLHRRRPSPLGGGCARRRRAQGRAVRTAISCR